MLLDNTYKPFPCGIVAHPAIEAAIGLHGWMEDPANPPVRSVVVRCNPLVVELMGRPTATTGLEARFCALHGVAVGLLFGAGGLEQFSDDIARDPGRRRAAAPLDARADRVLPARGRDRRGDASRTGRRSRTRSRSRRGAGSFPLTDDQLLRKFQALVEPVLPGRSGFVADAALGLGETTSFADIAAALGPMRSIREANVPSAELATFVATASLDDVPPGDRADATCDRRGR